MAQPDIIKHEIDMLTPPQLDKVEQFIRLIRQKESGVRSGILSELAAYQIDDDLPADLAEQHDHYLYGTPKR